MPNWIILIVCVAIPLAVGFTSGLLTRNESGGAWFQNLEKPPFNPPSWVFGPVWTCLYILMGVSLYLIFRATQSSMRTAALVAFGVQLVLNFCWSLIFFRYHLLNFAAFEIIILWVAILVMIVLFWNVRPSAAYLQVPYLAWVTFATVLTVSIYWLNRFTG